MNTISVPLDRLIDDAECQRLTSLSKTTRWRMARRGEFPAKVKVSAGRAAYRLSEVLAWIASRSPRREAN